MSWDGYIDNLIGHSKGSDGVAHVDRVAIFGMNGGALWTSSTHANALKISPSESSKIAANISAADATSNFATEGIVLEGVKYNFLRYDAEKKIALGKKRDHGAVTVQGSKTAVVVGHCPEGGQHGSCNDAVDKVVDYLVTNSY